MKKMIQAEDILMGTKSSRHYAAHTGSWISIIAATRSRQSQLPRGEGPGLGAAAAELSQPITANVLFMAGYTWSANNKAILERLITKTECKMATAGRERQPHARDWPPRTWGWQPLSCCVPKSVPKCVPNTLTKGWRAHRSSHTHVNPPTTMDLRNYIWYGRKAGRGEGGAENADTIWR